jgi:hypothetical protein
MLFSNKDRQESSTGLVIRVQVGKLRNWGLIPGKDKVLFSSAKYSEILKAHPVPIQCGT